MMIIEEIWENGVKVSELYLRREEEAAKKISVLKNETNRIEAGEWPASQLK